MATATPVQLYDKVSEEQALSRNARQYPGRPYIPNPYVPDMVNPYGNTMILGAGPGPGCEQKCQWSYFQQRQICDWWCARM